MSSNRIFSLAASLILLLSLSGCGKTVTQGEALFRGITASSSGNNTQYATVELGSISRNASSEATVTYPDYTTLTSIFADAILVSVNVKNNDSVKMGDVIAEFKIEYSEADLNTMRANLDIARKQYTSSLSSYEGAVTAAQSALTTAKSALASGTGTQNNVRRAELRLEKAQFSLTFFKSQQQATISAQQKAISDFEAKIADNKLLAPFDGTVVEVAYLTVGATIPIGTAICGIYSPETFWISGNIDITNSIRYNQNVEISITKDPKTYAGKVISAPNILGGAPTGRILVSLDFDGILSIDPRDRMKRISILGQRYLLDNVLVVPSAAVGNEEGSRFVYIYEDGVIKKRYVVTGLSSTSTIQIIDGLAAGQSVVVN